MARYWVVGKLARLGVPESVTERLTEGLNVVYAPLVAVVISKLYSIWVKVGQAIAGRSDMWPPAWVRRESHKGQRSRWLVASQNCVDCRRKETSLKSVLSLHF